MPMNTNEHADQGEPAILAENLAAIDAWDKAHESKLQDLDKQIQQFQQECEVQIDEPIRNYRELLHARSLIVVESLQNNLEMQSLHKLRRQLINRHLTGFNPLMRNYVEWVAAPEEEDLFLKALAEQLYRYEMLDTLSCIRLRSYEIYGNRKAHQQLGNQLEKHHNPTRRRLFGELLQLAGENEDGIQSAKEESEKNAIFLGEVAAELAENTYAPGVFRAIYQMHQQASWFSARFWGFLKERSDVQHRVKYRLPASHQRRTSELSTLDWIYKYYGQAADAVRVIELYTRDYPTLPSSELDKITESPIANH